MYKIEDMEIPHAKEMILAVECLWFYKDSVNFLSYRMFQFLKDD